MNVEIWPGSRLKIALLCIQMLCGSVVWAQTQVGPDISTLPAETSSNITIQLPLPCLIITELKALSATSFSVRWKVSEDENQGFRVYRDKQLIATVGPDVHEYEDFGLSPNTVYSYTVGALETSGEVLSQPVADATRLPNETRKETRVAFDVVVVGSTPGGVAAALTAARLGEKVALVSPSPWLGGMMSGGLSRTDVGSLKTAGGLFKEFVDRVRDFYEKTYGPNSPQLKASRGGYYFEPRVAKWIFQDMLAEQPNITVMLNHYCEDVLKNGNRVKALYVLDRPRMIRKTLLGKVFIDATYEGDLAAQSGAAYRMGRESKSEFGEEHAGQLLWDPVQRKVVGGNGAGDRKVQAYNYRLTLTKRPDNLTPFPFPKVYDRNRYVTLLPDIQSGRVKTLEQVMSILPIPDDKFDANNHPLGNPSTDLIGGADAYPELDLWKRESVAQAHRQHILGLLYFLQYDPEVPLSFREQARLWGFAADEYNDNDNFPTQLYVREGRRIVGRDIFTENDARSVSPEKRPAAHMDSVAIADYPIDSHGTTPEKNGLLEGFFYLPGTQTQASQVPYSVMTPLGIEGVIVSVCVSASHIGYGTLRMEPVFMSLGSAAGTAAHLAVQNKVLPSQLDTDALQIALLQRGQVICVFQDVPLEHPHWAALEYFGTKGFFPEFNARPDDVISRSEALQWLWKWLQLQKPAFGASVDDLAMFSDIKQDDPDFLAAHSLQHWGIVPPAPLLHPDLPLSPSDATAWLDKALKLAGRAALTPAPPTASSDPLTRGDFCQRLYDAELRHP